MATILAVDECGLNRTILNSILGEEHTIVAYSHPTWALERYYDHGPLDLLITGFHMTDMSGARFVEHVKHIDPSIPCIAVTGEADATEIQYMRNAGAELIVYKPYHVQGLRDAVNTLHQELTLSPEQRDELERKVRLFVPHPSQPLYR